MTQSDDDRRLSDVSSSRVTVSARHVVLVLAPLAIALSCTKLDEPELPFTGTSSSAISTDGTTIGAPTASPSPAPPPPPPAPPANIPPLNGITAPTVVDPLAGTSTGNRTPTLTVRNASSQDGAALSYDFQVSREQTFSNIVASVTSRPGGEGFTSWTVSPPLGSGTHYWRARAVGPAGPGPFTPATDVTIGSTAPGPGPGPGPAPPPSGGEIFDPLTNGSSIGEVSGGRFTSAGWQVTQRGNFIRYRVAPRASGFVEWENLNLTPFNPQRDLFTIMGMWDPSRGDYRENPFRVHIRKLDPNGHNPPWVRLRFISNGDQHDVGWDFLDWNPQRAYRWRLEWGPRGGGNEARVFLDERLIIRTGYGPQYLPNQQWIEMGIEERAETIVGLVFRNVRIGRR